MPTQRLLTSNPFWVKNETVFHGIKAEYPDADDEAARDGHDAHEVGIEHEQRGHGGKGEDAGHDEVVGRGHA